MKLSPLKILLSLTLIFTSLGCLADVMRKEYTKQIININPIGRELNLARHYISTGQYENAIEEYKLYLLSSDPVVKTSALKEISYLINYDKSGWDYFRQFYLVYVLYLLSKNLYILSFVCFLGWLTLFIIKFTWKRPELLMFD